MFLLWMQSTLVIKLFFLFLNLILGHSIKLLSLLGPFYMWSLFDNFIERFNGPWGLWDALIEFKFCFLYKGCRTSKWSREYKVFTTHKECRAPSLDVEHLNDVEHIKDTEYLKDIEHLKNLSHNLQFGTWNDAEIHLKIKQHKIFVALRDFKVLVVTSRM